MDACREPAEPVVRALVFGARGLGDRLVYDRNRAEALWDLRYRLEMFVPGKAELRLFRPAAARRPALNSGHLV